MIFLPRFTPSPDKPENGLTIIARRGQIVVVVCALVIEPKLQFLQGVTLGVANKIILKLLLCYHGDGRIVQNPSLRH